MEIEHWHDRWLLLCQAERDVMERGLELTVFTEEFLCKIVELYIVGTESVGGSDT